MGVAVLLLLHLLLGSSTAIAESLPELTRALVDSISRSVGVAQDLSLQRRQMVQQLQALGIQNRSVLKALAWVPRHRLVAPSQASLAYENNPLPLEHGQMISQPYIVAYMTQAADIAADETVLEVGTGSGYQTAVLAKLAKEVYSVEIIPALAARACGILSELGYRNVHIKVGNGYQGWAEQAPYDAIVVTAAPAYVPEALVSQLALNGKLVLPVGSDDQDMVVVTKTRDGLIEQQTIPVRFVPMTGTQ